MAWVALVVSLALLEYFVFLFMVGRARGRYGVAAPATSGNEMFERHFRVQQNTIEQLLIFLPSIYMFATFISATIASILGAIFVIGRAIYAVTYVRDPKSRSLGFLLTAAPTMILLAGAVVGAIRGVVALSNVG